ncbi:hypothetical protein OUZ56_005631 [Daphnia magna]|uniref:Uncharacterized protein n=1 Tax=Daphnia magna TaxID=35525 RepID=A0ABQ9YUN4_9CRUS|nr:hypothetical protein OUZ56_005631 [Daphnia magna]
MMRETRVRILMSNTCHIYSQMKAHSDILRMSDGAVEGGQNQKRKYIRRTSKSDIGLSGGYQKDVLNIRPRHLSDIRRTALCYVGTDIQSYMEVSFAGKWEFGAYRTPLCYTYFSFFATRGKGATLKVGKLTET